MMKTFSELLNSQNRLGREEMVGIGGGYHYKYHVDCNDGTSIDGDIEISDDASDEYERSVFEVVVDFECGDGVGGHGTAC